MRESSRKQLSGFIERENRGAPPPLIPCKGPSHKRGCSLKAEPEIWSGEIWHSRGNIQKTARFPVEDCMEDNRLQSPFSPQCCQMALHLIERRARDSFLGKPTSPSRKASAGKVIYSPYYMKTHLLESPPMHLHI